ncbi:MAG: hypothetical protein JXA42_16200 [Anaerolineales bacterium]|nr:hypothetical protein [Anaerolineales bacterium]
MKHRHSENPWVPKNAMLMSLPPEWPEPLLAEIRSSIERSGEKIVVLDDDPTGTQTVHGINILTSWPVDALRKEIDKSESPVFFILTNSRSLPLVEAQALNLEIGRNLAAAARQSGKRIVVISRSDSTLRGHFPGEVEALSQALENVFDAWFIIPSFFEGGRITIGDIHYVIQDEWLVPVAETEFAQDAAFGFRTSNLQKWVEEKSGGQIQARSVESIPLEGLRQKGPVWVCERLLKLEDRAICIVNAVGSRDLEVFSLGLLMAEERGKRFLNRTAASFVSARSGIQSHPILDPKEILLENEAGGLTLVGSYISATTRQIRALQGLPDLCCFEMKVEALLDKNRCEAEIGRLIKITDKYLSKRLDVVLYTSRQLITGKDAESSLQVGRRVSDGIVAIVQNLSTRPRYILVKGGITSSDVVTRALGVRRALVLGQILPGVPVWKLGTESKYPQLPYIVFPGNVGGPSALAKLINLLKVKLHAGKSAEKLIS